MYLTFKTTEPNIARSGNNIINVEGGADMKAYYLLSEKMFNSILMLKKVVFQYLFSF